MYILYTNSANNPSKSTAFFQTKEEAEKAKDWMLFDAQKRGDNIKVSIECDGKTVSDNHIANKLRKMAPTAAVYYMDDLIAEIDRLQTVVNELNNQINELTKDQ